jgi:hypothetical protein
MADYSENKNLATDHPKILMPSGESSGLGKILRYPSHLGTNVRGTIPLHSWMSFSSEDTVAEASEYNGNDPMTRPVQSTDSRDSNSHSSVELYIPESISVNGGVSWGEHEFGGNWGAAVKAGSNWGLGAITAAAEQKVSAAAYVDDGINFQKTENKLQNMNKQLLFEGVGMRTFEFKFEFAPRDKKESDMALSIVQWFRGVMYPEFDSNDHVWFTLPNAIDVKFHVHDDRNNQSDTDNLYKKVPMIQKSVITSCNITYGADGVFGVSEDTSPTAFTMDLTFQELNILTKDKIRKGF